MWSWSVGHLGSQWGVKSHRKQRKCVTKEERISQPWQIITHVQAQLVIIIISKFWFISTTFVFCLDLKTSSTLRKLTVHQTFVYLEMNAETDQNERQHLWAFLQLDTASCQKVKGNTSRQDVLPQAGSSSCWWWWGGLTCWLPFFITAWCLIHPNLSHYGRTRAPLVIRDSGGGTLYQPVLHCCRAEELCLSSFLFQSRPVQIKKLQTKFTRMKKQYFARLTPATFVDPLCVLRL